MARPARTLGKTAAINALAEPRFQPNARPHRRTQCDLRRWALHRRTPASRGVHAQALRRKREIGAWSGARKALRAASRTLPRAVPGHSGGRVFVRPRPAFL